MMLLDASLGQHPLLFILYQCLPPSVCFEAVKYASWYEPRKSSRKIHYFCPFPSKVLTILLEVGGVTPKP